MTGEDETTDGKRRARDNVVYEAGRFHEEKIHKGTPDISIAAD
jgi:hypothetical protein